MSTFDPPIVMTRDGEEITVRNTADYVRLRFDGWILVGPGGPEPVVGPSVKTVNGIPGPAVLLTAANIPGLEELIAGSSAGLSEAQVVSLINTATAALVNSAPAALNTLDELAAALGDDANFAATVTSALAGKAALVHTHSADDIVESSTGKVLTAAERTKLAGIATGATANSSDTFLRARSNHTGSQLANTISDFAPAVSAAISSAGYAPSADPTFTGLTTISGFRLGQLSKSADYTVAANDPSYIAVATGSGNVTITLPAAAPAGTIFIIKKTDGNGGNVTISANTDGFTIPSLNSQYDVMGLISTGAGSNYSILFTNKPVRIQASSTDLGTVLSNLGMRTSGSAYSITTSGTVTLSGTTNLSNYTTGGARFSTYQVRTAAVTLTTGTAEHQYLDATTAGFDVTLPTTTTPGLQFTFRRVDNVSANTLRILGTFDGGTTNYLLRDAGDWVTIQSTSVSGTWRIVMASRQFTPQGNTTDLGLALSNLGIRQSGTAYPITTSGPLALTGPLRLGSAVKSTTATLTLTDVPYIMCDASAGGFTVTLPSTTTPGTYFTIKKTDLAGGTVQVTSAGTSLIDNSTSLFLTSQGDFVTVVSTGVSGTWNIVASRYAGSFSSVNSVTFFQSVRFSHNTLTANATLTGSSTRMQMADATTAAFTVTLPSTTSTGYEFMVKKTDGTSNTVTVTSSGTPLIDGAASIVLAAKDDWVIVQSTGTAGTWRIVGRSAPNLIPSYIVAPALLRKSFDPNTGLYNLNARTMKKARAGLGRAGVGGKMQAVFLGDSTMIGFDGTATVESNSYPRRVQNAITQLTGIRSAGTGFVPAVANNDRWGFTGTVDRVTYPGLCTIFPSSTATYTSVIKGTSVEAIYSNQSNAGGTITIDGGAPISLPVTGAATLRREVLATGLADTTHTVVFTPASGGYIFLSHVAIRHSTGLEFHNLSVGGTMADFGTATTNWSSVAAAPTTKTSVLDPITAYITDPDLFVIAIGGNDLYNGDTNVHAIAGAKKLRDIYPNASIIMIQGWRLGVVPAATANDYLERKYQLADQYDFAVHDFQAYSGTLEEATALSLLGADSAHPKNEAVFGWGLSSGKAIAS